MQLSYAKDGAITVISAVTMPTGKDGTSPSGPSHGAGLGGDGGITGEAKVGSRVHDGPLVKPLQGDPEVSEICGEVSLPERGTASPHSSGSRNPGPPDTLTEHKYRWQTAKPPRQYRRRRMDDIDLRSGIVWGLSSKTSLKALSLELKSIGLGDAELQWMGPRNRSRLHVIFESQEIRDRSLPQLRKLVHSKTAAHVSKGRIFRAREAARRTSPQVGTPVSANSYRVLVEDQSEEQGVRPEADPLEPIHIMHPLDLGTTPAPSNRRKKHRRGRRYMGGKNRDIAWESFRLKVGTHNWAGKVLSGPGAAEWPDHYAKLGLHVVFVQEHCLSAERLKKLKMKGYKIFAKPTPTGHGGVLILVANVLAPYVMRLPDVDHPNQLWIKLAADSGDRKRRHGDLYLGNSYMPQVTDELESVQAFVTYESSIKKHQAQGHVLAAGDMNAWLSTFQSPEEERYVGRYGEGKRNANGDLLAGLLVRTSMVNLGGQSAPPPQRGTYWWTRQDPRGSRHALDYILVSPELAPGAAFHVDDTDLGVDHRLPCASVTWRDHRPQRAKKPKPRRVIKTEKLIYPRGKNTDDEAKAEINQLRAKYDGAFAEEFKRRVKELPPLEGKTPENKERAVRWVTRSLAASLTLSAEQVLGIKTVRAGFSKKWYDGELKAQIQLRRHAAAEACRDEADLEAQQRWKDLERTTRRMTRRKKKFYYHQFVKDVNQEQSSKRKWAGIQRIGGKSRSKNSAPLRCLDGSLACSTAEKVEAWADYREKLGTPPTNPPSLPDSPAPGERPTFRYNDEFLRQVEQQVQEYATHTDEKGPLDYDFTPEELATALEKLVNHKAYSSSDKVPNELLKYGGDAVKEVLLEVFNWLIKAEMCDTQWLTSVVVNLFKSGDATLPGNYRGISIMSCLGKLYASLWATRLTTYIDDKIRQEQGGFRPGRGTVDQVYTLAERLRRRRQRRQDSYLLFIDFRKAFDTVWRDGLFKRLWSLESKVRPGESFAFFMHTQNQGYWRMVNSRGNC